MQISIIWNFKKLYGCKNGGKISGYNFTKAQISEANSGGNPSEKSQKILERVKKEVKERGKDDSKKTIARGTFNLTNNNKNATIKNDIFENTAGTNLTLADGAETERVGDKSNAETLAKYASAVVKDGEDLVQTTDNNTKQYKGYYIMDNANNQLEIFKNYNIDKKEIKDIKLLEKDIKKDEPNNLTSNLKVIIDGQLKSEYSQIKKDENGNYPDFSICIPKVYTVLADEEDGIKEMYKVEQLQENHDYRVGIYISSDYKPDIILNFKINHSRAAIVKDGASINAEKYGDYYIMEDDQLDIHYTTYQDQPIYQTNTITNIRMTYGDGETKDGLKFILNDGEMIDDYKKIKKDSSGNYPKISICIPKKYKAEKTDKILTDGQECSISISYDSNKNEDYSIYFKTGSNDKETTQPTETRDSRYKDYWILRHVQINWTYAENEKSYISDIQLLDSGGNVVCKELTFAYDGKDYIKTENIEDEYENIKSEKENNGSPKNIRIYIPKNEVDLYKTYKIKIIHKYINEKSSYTAGKTYYSGTYTLYRNKNSKSQDMVAYDTDKKYISSDKDVVKVKKTNDIKIKIRIDDKILEEKEGKYVKYLYGVYKKGVTGEGVETAVNGQYGLIGKCVQPKWNIETGECTNIEELKNPYYISGDNEGNPVELDGNADNDEYVLIYKMQFFVPKESSSVTMAEIVGQYNLDIGSDNGQKLIDTYTNSSLKLIAINSANKSNTENKSELDWRNYVSPNSIQIVSEKGYTESIPDGITAYNTDPRTVAQWSINQVGTNGVVNVTASGLKTTVSIDVSHSNNSTITAGAGAKIDINSWTRDKYGNYISLDEDGDVIYKNIYTIDRDSFDKNEYGINGSGNLFYKENNEQKEITDISKIEGLKCSTPATGTGETDGYAFLYYYTPKNEEGITQALNVSGNPVNLDSGKMSISGKVFLDGYDTVSGKVTQDYNGVADDNEKWTKDNVKVELFKADYDSTIQDHYNYANATIIDNSLINSEDGSYSFDNLKKNMFDPETDMPSNYNEMDAALEKMSQKISYIVRFLYNGERYETTIYEAQNQDETRTSHAKESDTGAYSTLSNITRQDFNQKIENANLRKTSPAANDEANANSANESMADYSSMYEIDATTPNGITEATSWKDHVNLGVVRRNLDLSLKNQLEYMDISINGVTQNIPSINDGVISAEVLNQDIEFLKSDYEYTDSDTSKELTATVHYKVTVTNESSDNYKAIVNGINLYYDNAFTDIKVEGYTTTPIEGYGDFEGVNISCGKAITNNAGNNTTEFNIDMTLTRNKIAEILSSNSGKTLETVAEISGYESYYSGDIYSTGRHKEDEVAGKLDEDSVPSNIDINKYVSEIRGSNDYAKILEFFNEDDAGRALGIKLTSNIEDRKITGTVFEDATEKTKKYIYGNNDGRDTRLGDGEYNSNGKDKGIENVKVELIDNSNRNHKKYEVRTGKDGTFTINKVIPSADYIIQFTYGNGETKQYNCQDYKSTIDTTGSEYSPTGFEQIGDNKKPSTEENNYWYADSNINNKSVAKDTDMKETESTLNYEKAVDLENIYKASEYYYNTANTAKFFVPITKYGVSETKNNSAYTVSNMNLGIAERPRSELTINKEVDHLTITTSDGRVLIDGKQKANSTSWTKKYVQAIVDENLVYGSTLKITYKYTVENTGEVNYTDDDFYYYGKKGTSEVTTSADKIIDYVDNNLMYDENMQASPDVADKVNSNYWTEASDDDLELLGSNVIEDAKNINTKLVSNQLNKELKPGDTTEEIYLTLSKVLSSSGDKNNESLVYNNYVEIIQSTNTAGRRSYRIKDGTKLSDLDNTKRGAPVVDDSGELKNENNTYILTIPGDLNPKTLKTLEYEPDSAKAQEVQIVPPFGNQKLIWIAIGTTAAIILAGGIYLIKKKVL